LFVPLWGGESHTPEEGAEMSEIVHATRVAAGVLGRYLAGPPSPPPSA
jgi:hypothetical protein